jgi:hypothetical protein
MNLVEVVPIDLWHGLFRSFRKSGPEGGHYVMKTVKSHVKISIIVL